jgi:hypothetical protein
MSHRLHVKCKSAVPVPEPSQPAEIGRPAVNFQSARRPAAGQHKMIRYNIYMLLSFHSFGTNLAFPWVQVKVSHLMSNPVEEEKHEAYVD